MFAYETFVYLNHSLDFKKNSPSQMLKYVQNDIHGNLLYTLKNLRFYVVCCGSWWWCSFFPWSFDKLSINSKRTKKIKTAEFFTKNFFHFGTKIKDCVFEDYFLITWQLKAKNNYRIQYFCFTLRFNSFFYVKFSEVETSMLL